MLAHVPDDAPNEFFILTQYQINQYIDAELKRLGRDSDYSMMGILWSQAAGHTDWLILPP